MNQIQKVQKAFSWYSTKPKINHKTLCNAFEEGGLKNVDIKTKYLACGVLRLKKLFDGNHRDWKIIPLFLINKYFGKNFHLHPNLSLNLSLADSFREFYKQILMNWSTYFVLNSEVPSCIQSNYLWYNRHLLIHNRPVYLHSFADKNVNSIGNLLDASGKFKSWNELKTVFTLADNLYFSWMQLINSMPLNWRNIIKDNCSSTTFSKKE